MSAPSEAWVVKHSPYKGTTYAVHKAIAEVVNKEREWLFYARLTEFSRKTRISRKAIGAAIARMVADGYLRVVRSPLRADELTSAGRPTGTGRPGIYEFVFVKGAAVVYDAEGSTFAPEEGGESIDAPPGVEGLGRESHAGISAGHGSTLDDDSAPEEGGESIDAPHRGGESIDAPGESIDAPGESIDARGESIDARNFIELQLNEEIPLTPASGGRRSEGTNQRALGTNQRAQGRSPRDRGTNPRAVDVDAFLAADTGDDPELVHAHFAAARGALDPYSEGAQP